ncbi:MAG: 3-deoxy-manno-octulosonate cytidylyltransferase [bacterium]
METLGIIPARYESSRFPGKSLVEISGKPLIQHVYEKASLARSLDDLVVATDDERIFDEVERFGGKVLMTRKDHPTGTDRLAEVAVRHDADLYVNIQGDEPLIDPSLIDRAVHTFGGISGFQFGSAMTPIRNDEDVRNPNVVKVVVDSRKRALYFSRHSIPYRRKETTLPCYQHIGFYVYARNFLLAFPNMPSTPLEQAECLEQLRALENGIHIHMIETNYRGIGVDAPEDIKRIEAIMKTESSR